MSFFFPLTPPTTAGSPPYKVAGQRCTANGRAFWLQKSTSITEKDRNIIKHTNQSPKHFSRGWIIYFLYFFIVSVNTPNERAVRWQWWDNDEIGPRVKRITHCECHPDTCTINHRRDLDLYPIFNGDKITQRTQVQICKKWNQRYLKSCDWKKMIILKM